MDSASQHNTHTPTPIIVPTSWLPQHTGSWQLGPGIDTAVVKPWEFPLKIKPPPPPQRKLIKLMEVVVYINFKKDQGLQLPLA